TEWRSFKLHLAQCVICSWVKINLFSKIQAGEQSGGELYWKGENSLRLTPSSGGPGLEFVKTSGKNYGLFTLKANRRSFLTIPDLPSMQPPEVPDMTEKNVSGLVLAEGEAGTDALALTR
ncbi:unnamed protein product, partial [Choristocarpus tenellus]